MSTVLLIDDDTSGLRIRHYLMATAHYDVLSATTGAAGVARFKLHPVDLVILDYNLPDMNGGEVLAQMRAAKPSVPVILLSGALDIPEAVLRAVDEAVTKGDSPEELLKIVARHIGVPARA